jgi:hypothetical protein
VGKEVVNDYLLTKVIQFGINIEHFKANRKYHPSELAVAIQSSKTWKEAASKLGIKHASYLRIICQKHSINFSHLKTFKKGNTNGNTITKPQV